MPLVVGIVAIAVSAFLVGLIAGFQYCNRQWARMYAGQRRAAAVQRAAAYSDVDTPGPAGVQEH